LVQEQGNLSGVPTTGTTTLLARDPDTADTKQYHGDPRRDRWILIAILALGVALRLQHLTAPLADAHNWRQTQTAMISRNLSRDGFNLWSPHVDFYCTELCSTSGLLVLEFPLYNAIVALLANIFGLQEILGRLVSILFSIGAALLLYYLTKHISGVPTALFAVLYFVLSPISIFYARAFMPESLMLFAGIGALVFFHKWLKEERWPTFTVAVVFTIATFLVKFPMIHIIIPMAYMAWSKYGFGIFRERTLALFAALFLLPSAIWFVHSVTSPNLGMSWVTSDLNLLRSKELYQVMWNRLGQDVLTSIGRILFVVGLLLGPRRTEERVLGVWLGAAILYVLVFGRGNIVHHYYQLPLVPIASIYIGKTMAQLPRLGFQRLWRLPFTALLIVATGVESWTTVKPWYGEEIPNLYRFAETVKRVTPTGVPIVVSSSLANFAPWDPRLLYAFDRKGWNICPADLPWQIDSLYQRGARHLVIYPTDGLDADLVGHLRTRSRALTVPDQMGGAIFELAPSPAGTPMQPLQKERFIGKTCVRKGSR
jgi:hypothetical protein